SHQHGIVAAHQPPLGKAAEIIHQRHIELRLQRTAGAMCDLARIDQQLGRKRHDAATIGKARADDAADAATQPRVADAALPAKDCPNTAENPLVPPRPRGKGGRRALPPRAPPPGGTNHFEPGPGTGPAKKPPPNNPEAPPPDRRGNPPPPGRVAPAIGSPARL